MSHHKCSGHRSARLPGALSHWPSNISWFIRSHLWPPGQLGAVGAVKGALVTFYCVVIHWNWLAWPRILIFWKNSNHPETHRPSVPEQVGEGWMSSFGRLPRETAEGRNPLCPLWSPFRLPTQSTRCISAQGMEVGGWRGGGAPRRGSEVLKGAGERGEVTAALGSIRRLACLAPTHHQDLLNVCSLNIS